MSGEAVLVRQENRCFKWKFGSPIFKWLHIYVRAKAGWETYCFFSFACDSLLKTFHY